MAIQYFEIEDTDVAFYITDEKIPFRLPIEIVRNICFLLITPEGMPCPGKYTIFNYSYYEVYNGTDLKIIGFHYGSKYDAVEVQFLSKYARRLLFIRQDTAVLLTQLLSKIPTKLPAKMEI